MSNDKANQEERALAETKLECYHEGITPEDIALRNEIYFHITVLVTTSPWWLALKPEKRESITQHLVQCFEKDGALDVLYGK